MIEAIALRAFSALGASTVVKVPVPRSASSGIWIADRVTSGLGESTWWFIAGTLDLPAAGHADFTTH